MSYIPKYILKRMITADAVKAIPEGVEITAINVISPTTVAEVPKEGVLDKVEFIIDGKPISMEQKAKVKLTFGEKTVMANKLNDLEGTTLPVGGKIIFILPIQLNKGETHKFELKVNSNRPTNIEFERVVS